MLSLPLIPPQDDHSTLLGSSWRPRADSPPPSNPQTAAQHPQQHRQNRQLRDEEKRQQQARSPLALLAADEAAIAQRKAAIRNFGAYWIRPPGIPKTLQAMNEEEQERREQEEIERRERGMLDMQAQQQLAEAQQRGAEAMAEQEDPEAPEERDLDDDIPEAEITGDVTGDITGVTDDVTAEDTFNEESMMEGSMLQQEQYAEMEEAELTGIAQEEEDLGIEGDEEEERDLDDDVPDAGSYQHTDTEEEDSSSSSEEESSEVQDSFAQQSARRSARVSAQRQQQQQQQQLSMQTPVMGSLQERMRAQVGAADSLPRSPGSVNLSSSILESSFIGSSPMMQRGNQGPRARGRANRRGRLS
ncbi:hypothetical protein WHR41_08903 [Cladosporium halotolerans]|uniref:Uncharacterized protein n=1 Tax=Cladosporium halotolerans TaxID=1052096 RepID=A0AB34KBP8_9PEZI